MFILSSFGFLAFVVYLALSRYGGIRLGGDDERPEFRTASWVAMMFSAGMGIGLMFYGVAEPISHLTTPPHGLAKPGTEDAAQVAMEYSYFHWAFHPWAMYAVVGLALAYFCFRKGRPNLISEAFRPILGDRVDGPIGRTIDILAIFATLFGSATSLGLGALQINGGLNYLWDVPNSTAIAIVIIAVMTALFVVSAVTGVHRGIQWLSNTNMVLAAVLVLFLFVLGPTVFILNTFVESLGGYVARLVPMSFRSGAFSSDSWLASWTIFYWAWWISWTPFVGTFIARISRGRTIREFVVGVLLVPSVVSFVWFAVLGGTAINLELRGVGNIADAVGRGPEIALFSTLNQFPLAAVMSLIAVILGSALLHQRGGRGVSGNGDAVLQGHLESQGAGRGHLGVAHGRRGGDLSAGRGSRRFADGGHHIRGTVRARHDRTVLVHLQGAARRAAAGRGAGRSAGAGEGCGTSARGRCAAAGERCGSGRQEVANRDPKTRRVGRGESKRGRAKR